MRSTKITCDLKGCNVSFYISDTEPPSAGVEDIVQIMLSTGTSAYFCSMRHLLQWGVDYIKASEIPAASDTNMDEKQQKILRQMGIIVGSESTAHKAMEELESLVPLPPEDLELKQ